MHSAILLANVNIFIGSGPAHISCGTDLFIASHEMDEKRPNPDPPTPPNEKQLQK